MDLRVMVGIRGHSKMKTVTEDSGWSSSAWPPTRSESLVTHPRLRKRRKLLDIFKLYAIDGELMEKPLSGKCLSEIQR